MHHYILVTRPQQNADEFTSRLSAAGYEALLSPLLAYAEVDTDYTSLIGAQAVMLTSSFAAEIFSRHATDKSISVFAVGGATAQAAAKAGFTRVWSADGDVTDLVRLVLSRKQDFGIRKIVHICGDDTAQDIGGLFEGSGIDVIRSVVYKAHLVDNLSPDVMAAMARGEIAVVTFFSARAAARFVDILHAEKRDVELQRLHAVCLSPRIAERIQPFSWKSISIAGRPNIEAMIEAVAALPRHILFDQRELAADPVIAAFGGIRPLAARLHLTASTVQGWKKRGAIPETRVSEVAAAAEEDKIDLAPFWRNTPAATGGRQARGSIMDKVENKSASDRRGQDRRQRLPEKDTNGRIITQAYAGPDRRAQDRRAFSQRQQSSIRHEKFAFVVKSVAMTGFVLSLVAVGAIFIMAPEYLQMREDTRRMREMEGQVRAVNERLYQMQKAQVKTTSLSSAISGKIEQIKSTTESVVRPAAEAVDTVAAIVSQLSTDAGSSSNAEEMLLVLSRINGYSRTPEGRIAVSSAVGSLKSILAGSNASPDVINEAIALAARQNPVLGGILEGIAPEDMGAAGMLLALSEFRTSLGRQQPFAEDLGLLKKFVGASPEMTAALDKLAPYAATGVLSRDGLKQQFGAMAMDIVMAKLEGEDLTAQEELLKRLEKFIRVRKISDIQGTTVDAIVARTQLLLEGGDIASAVGELRALNGTPAEVAAPWISQASGLLAAQDASDLLLSSVVRGMAMPEGGFSLDGLIDAATGGIFTEKPVDIVSPALLKQE